MSAFKDPFDPALALGACSCGEHRSQADHDAARVEDTTEALNRRVIESAVMRALFPQDAMRRRFLRAVGASTAMARDLQRAAVRRAGGDGAGEGRRWRRRTCKIGFIPITCATPLIMADPLGFYQQAGPERQARSRPPAGR